MILYQDVEDDLIEAFPEYYARKGGLLMYQNGKDNSRYEIMIVVKHFD